MWGGNNTGYLNSTTKLSNMKLYGSNSNPANATDGTVIGTIATNLAGPNNSDNRTLMSGITATSYEYVWVAILPASTGAIYTAEVEFYETTGTVTGKEARLHGWAVNY